LDKGGGRGNVSSRVLWSKTLLILKGGKKKEEFEEKES